MNLMSTQSFPQDADLSAIKTYQVGALESAAHRTLRQYKDGLLKPYGLTGMEWYVIGTVADAGEDGIRTTDLANSLGTTIGFMTKTINLLVAKQILSRDSNKGDARSTFVVLNKKYQPTIDEIEGNLRAKLRKTIYGKLSREELAIYIKAVQTLASIGK